MSIFRHEQILVEGISLHMVQAGNPSAQPIVLLHGWPQSWIEWQEVMSLAAGEFRAIAIDLPGIGGSTPPVADSSKRALAAVVHGLIEQLDLKGATLVGHDVGGMIAYAYLRRYEDVAGVVIIDVVIPGLDPWDEVIRNPYIWHFAFHAIPRLPELLVQGHQAPYLDYFFDILAVNRARITPGQRATYALAYASDDALKPVSTSTARFPKTPATTCAASAPRRARRCSTSAARAAAAILRVTHTGCERRA